MWSNSDSDEIPCAVLLATVLLDEACDFGQCAMDGGELDRAQFNQVAGVAPVAEENPALAGEAEIRQFAEEDEVRHFSSWHPPIPY